MPSLFIYRPLHLACLFNFTATNVGGTVEDGREGGRLWFYLVVLDFVFLNGQPLLQVALTHQR